MFVLLENLYSSFDGYVEYGWLDQLMSRMRMTVSHVVFQLFQHCQEASRVQGMLGVAAVLKQISSISLILFDSDSTG